VKRAIDVAPFGELADPRVLADLAARAEDRGWDGFFVWDHIHYRAPVRAVADPWVALAAVACATSRVRIGALVTPLSRRRVHKLARETVTLDRLSSGRLTFGAGLGSARNNELEPYGEVTDPRERARLLDQGLDALAELAAAIRGARPDGPFDLITELPADTDLGPWEQAGLTWAVTDFGIEPTVAAVRAVIDAGPAS
jgi:alkanesulfonate monooxygenase SsuD/methylene tetrahydromethanopterin reductase-like flavin-dependent oxidoreductase (luciferase family)